MQLKPGQFLGRYQILELIGQGGMAVVYKALDTRLERPVAVKILRTGVFPQDSLDQILKRFEREAKSLAALSHANIVNVLDYGEQEGAPYLVMEYLPGGTLSQRLGKPLHSQAAVKLMLPVARALAYAHREGIIHRDVKPSNILLTKDGEPKLADFGIAKILDDSGGQTLTGTGVGIGTPEYMAPEQGLGKPVDARADVYAVGIVLYELVTGRKPYTADTPMGVIYKHLSEPLPSPRQIVPDLPEAVEQVLLKALAKQPDDRYPNMGAMIADIEFLVSGGAAAAPQQAGKPVVDHDSTVHDFLQDPDPDDQSPVLAPTVKEKRVRTPGADKVRSLSPSSGEFEYESTPPKSKWPFWFILPGVLILAWSGILFLDRVNTSTPASSLAAVTHTAAPTATKSAVPTRTSSISPTRAFTNTPLPTTLPPDPATPTISPTPLPSRITDEKWVSMALVPAGEFSMGSDSRYSDEQPVHKVYLDDFYIDIYEVTNARYAACVSWGDCKPKLSTSSNSRNNYYGNPDYNNFPVVKVSWQEALDYCLWRGARLPTEAEWEKAARGGLEGKLYPWGDDAPVCTSKAANGANFAGCSSGVDTWRVGSFAPNGYGLYDMAGNASEWVADWYGLFTGAYQTNPTGPLSGEKHVVRGGGAHSMVDYIRVSYRYNGSYSTSFRCAAPVVP